MLANFKYRLRQADQKSRVILSSLNPRVKGAIRFLRQVDYSQFKDLEKWAVFNERILIHLRSLPHSHLLTGQTDEVEFLPAALEVIETPPSPTGRIIAFSIMAFLLIALLWAIFGSVDIIATSSR